MHVPPSSSTLETWRALLGTRRIVGVLAASAMLLATWHSVHPGFAPVAIGVLLCVATVLLAPLSYRLLFPRGIDSVWHVVRLVVYGFVGVGVVLGVGHKLPMMLGLDVTFWTVRAKGMCVALFLIGGWMLGRDISLQFELEREQGRANAAEREAQQAQLLAFRSHLDPHFLFNTLNAIAEWCRQDGEVAEGAVLRLSEMLRMVLSGVKVTTWSLAQELELLQSLWKLHLLRDPNLFTLRIDAPSPLPDIQIPSMILLPLAENAVKHGPAAGHRGEIVLTVRIEDGQLRVTLDNPGRYGGPRAGSDGLPVVERRLELAYAGEARLRIGPQTPARTRAEIDLPLHPPVHGVPLA
jgi:signal transduction histidine kinase